MKKAASKPAKAVKAAAKASAKAVVKGGKSVGSKAKKLTRKVVPAKVKAKVAAKVKPALKPKAKPAPKPSPKAAPKLAQKLKAAVKPLKKKDVAAPAAAAPPAAKAPASPPKPPRARRARTRSAGSSNPVANWFPQAEDRPRSSSFIPAPPRAEAPSTTAAPPASSDRIVRATDLIEHAIRTIPVRVDVEQSGGRAFLIVYPEQISIREGEGIEWDFRYIGGTDAIADEIVIEFDKPSPFSRTVFRSKHPGAARPHRQLPGPAGAAAVGREFSYRIRCISVVKTEMASASPRLAILG